MKENTNHIAYFHKFVRFGGKTSEYTLFDLKMKRLLSVLIFVLVWSSFSYAQLSREFWFVAPDLTPDHRHGSDDCLGGNERYLNFTNPSKTNSTVVEISQPANLGFTPISFTIDPDTTMKIDISEACMSGTHGDYNTIENTPYDQVNPYGIHIKSQYQITAYYEIYSIYNPELWALKGTNALGDTFFIAMQNFWQNMWQWYAPVDPYNEFHIVATEDDTEVKIYLKNYALKQGGGFYSPGDSIIVTLDEGETFAVRAHNVDGSDNLDGDEHLGGSMVVANKPIAVTVSDDSVNKPDGCADVNGDQLVPKSILGTEHVIMKGQVNIGESVFVIATEDNTDIYVDGNPGAVNLDAGETQRVQFNADYMYIETSKPAYIWHVGGFGCEMGAAQVPSIFCTGSRKVSCVRSKPSNYDFFINLMVPASGIDNFVMYYDTVGSEGKKTFNIPSNWFEPVVFMQDMGPGSEAYTSEELWYVIRDSRKEFTNIIEERKAFTIENTSDYFHMGIINGLPTSGCNYGYFSDFGRITPSYEFVDDWTNGNIGTKLCYGEDLQLQAFGGLEYWWYRTTLGEGDTAITYLSDRQSDEPVASPIPGIHYYHCHIKGECDLDTTLSYIYVSVADYIKADFEIEEPIVCAPDTTVILNKTIGANHETNAYNWDFGDSSVIVKDTTSIIKHYYENIGQDSAVYNIFLRVQNSLGCFDTTSKNVMIYPEINAKFAMNPDPAIGCNPLPVEFSDSSSGNLGTWQWDFGDLTGTVDTVPGLHIYTNTGEVDSMYIVSLITTSPYFCTDTMIDTVKVYPFIESKFSIDKNAMCAPDSIKVINNSRGGIKSVIWDFGSGTPMTATPEDDSIFYVKYENTTTSVIYDTIELTVRNLYLCDSMIRRPIQIYPEVTADFTVNATEGCSPFTIDFTDASNATAQLANNYNWEFGDEGSSSDQSVSHLFTNNGTIDSVYRVYLTTISENSCVANDSIDITIHPFVDADFAINQASGCADYTVSIDDASLGDTEFYAWDYGDGETADVQIDHTHQYTNDGAVTLNPQLRLIVSNAEGCADTVIRYLTVYPKIETDIIADSTIGCHPFEVVFSDTNYTGAVVQSYFWDFGDGISYNGQTSSHTYNNFTSNDTTYFAYRKVITNEGCIDEDTIEITVYSYVEADFSMDKTSGCGPLNVYHSLLATGDYSRIFWTFGEAGTSELENPPFEYDYIEGNPNPVDYTVTLRVVNSSGQCSDRISKTVSVYPVPNVRFDLDPDNLPANTCQPLTYAYKNYSDAVAVQYVWDFGDSTSFTINSRDNVSKTYSNLTSNALQYTTRVIGISQFYCRDTAQRVVSVAPYIESDFSIVSNASGCSPITTQFENNPQGDYASALWVYGDGTEELRTDYEASHTFPEDLSSAKAKTYNVKVIAYNSIGCADTSVIRKVTVYPDVKADFSLDAYEKCSPFIPVFTNNSSSHVKHYFWEFEYQGQTSSAANPTGSIQFLNTNRSNDTTYTINLSVQSQYYCEDDTSIDVKINYQPYASISVQDPSSPDQPINCSPYAPGYVNASLSGNGSTYQWQDDKGTNETFTNNINVPSTIYRNTGNTSKTYTMTLTVTTPSGCFNTSNISVLVYPEVIANYTHDSAGCDPLNAQFDGTLSINGEYLDWDFDDGTHSTEDKPVHEYRSILSTYDKSYTFTLTAESIYRCKDDTTGNVVVYANPKADFSVSPNLRQTYPDTTFTFLNTSNEIGWLFEWQFDSNQEIDTIADTKFDRSFPSWIGGDYEVLLTATNMDHPECTDNLLRYIYVDPPPPEPGFWTDPIEGCEPLVVDFYDTSLYHYANKNVWDFNDGSNTIKGGTQRTHTFSNAGTYRASLQVTGPESTRKTFRTVTVYEKPEPKYKIEPKLLILPEATITCHNLTEGGSKFTYTWDFGDGSDPVVAFEPTYTYLDASGSGEGFFVTLIAETDHGCTDTITDELMDTIRVEGVGDIVFPNAFSPHNADHVNDIFRPCCNWEQEDIEEDENVQYYAQCDCRMIREFRFQVFNRWGEKVFDVSGSDNNIDDLGWDGTLYKNGGKIWTGEKAPQGVYVFKFTGIWSNGEVINPPVVGDVLLID